jgi:DNA-binding transcriptional MerR regulator
MPYPSLKMRYKAYLNTAEVAELFGITKQTVLNWIRQGKIIEPERNPVNNYRLWSESDVQRVRDMIRERQLAQTRHR